MPSLRSSALFIWPVLFFLIFVPARGWAQTAARATAPMLSEQEAAGEEEAVWHLQATLWGGSSELDVPNASGVLESTQVYSEVLLLTAAYAVTKRIELGLKVPLVFGRLNPDNSPSRTAPASFGNMALEAQYQFHPSQTVTISPLVALAVPTAQGEDVKEDPPVPPTPEERRQIDRFYMLRAAEFMQGSQETALYEPGRLGVTVGGSLLARLSGVRIRGWLQLESMFDVVGDIREPVIVELAFGVAAGWKFPFGLELGLGFGSSLPLTAHEERRFEAAFLTPYVQWRFLNMHLSSRAVLPVAGNASLHNSWGLALAWGIAL